METILPPATGLEDATWTASNLVGHAEPDEFFRRFSIDELVVLAAERLEDLEKAKRDILQCLLAVLWHAGPLPADRARAIYEFTGKLAAHSHRKYSHRYMRKFAALVLTIHPDELDGQFAEATVGHALLAVENTSVAGEDPYSPARSERAKAVLAEALDRNLSQDETRRLAREYALRDQERLGNPEAPIVAIERIETPEPYWEQFLRELEPIHIKVFKAEQPGTHSGEFACTREAILSLRDRWIISPR